MSPKRRHRIDPEQADRDEQGRRPRLSWGWLGIRLGQMEHAGRGSLSIAELRELISEDSTMTTSTIHHDRRDPH